jgi:hypothetical protein
MSALINLRGRRFTRLTVIDRGRTVSRGEEGTAVYWMCRCDCGTIHEVRSAELRKGSIKSCGCLLAELRQPHFERTSVRLPSPAC